MDSSVGFRSSSGPSSQTWWHSSRLHCRQNEGHGQPGAPVCTTSPTLSWSRPRYSQGYGSSPVGPTGLSSGGSATRRSTERLVTDSGPANRPKLSQRDQTTLSEVTVVFLSTTPRRFSNNSPILRDFPMRILIQMELTLPTPISARNGDYALEVSTCGRRDLNPGYQLGGLMS